jgi:hypothetical protein
MSKSKFRSRLEKISLCFISLLLFLVLAELAARQLFFSPEERASGAAAIWAKTKNAYVTAYEDDKPCDFTDSMIPHPYLGFVRHSLPPCGIHSNNLGIIHREKFPEQYDPNFFSILIVGGSVAKDLAYGPKNTEANWLAHELNKKYRSPNGKPFRIVSGAGGSWNFPNQLTMLHLYSERFDAILALDGYNEALHAVYGRAISKPDEYIFLYVARPKLLDNFNRYISLAKWMRRKGARSSLKNSYLYLASFRALLGYLSDYRSENARLREKLLTDFFILPKEWERDQIDAWNKKKYQDYIRSLGATAQALGLKYAHFVQPHRLLDKELNTEEKQYQSLVDPLLYKKIFIAGSRAEQARGLFSFDLTSVFSKESATIYSDDIHYGYEANGDSLGYRLVAEAMSEKIARAWKLKKR